MPVISPAELEHSAFTEAHLRGSRPVGYRATSAIAVEIGRQLRAGERFVYAYYGGVDKTAHERGFGDFYDAELRAADRLVGDILDVLPPGAALLVTADHGQVDVGDRIDRARPRACSTWWRCSRARDASGGGTPGRGAAAELLAGGDGPLRRRRPGWSPGSRSSTRAGSARSSPAGARPASATWRWWPATR